MKGWTTGTKCCVNLMLALSFLPVVSSVDPSLSPLLAPDEHLRGPGVRSRLSPSALSHVSTSIVHALIQETVSSRFPLASSALSHSSVRVSNLRLLSASVSEGLSPRILTLHPNVLKATVTDIAMTLLSEATGVLGDGPFHTPLLLNATGATALVDVAVSSDAVGNPVLKMVGCDIPTGFPMVVSYNRSMGAKSRQELVNLASHDAIGLFRDTLCPRLKSLLEERINGRFAALPPRMSLAKAADADLVQMISDAGGRRAVRPLAAPPSSANGIRKAALRWKRQATNRISSLISHFDLTRAKNLFLDYSMPLPPVASADGFDIFSSGEISSLGVPTPFGPRPLPSLPRTNHSAMLQIVLSDFVPNSLMYHGHKTGLFNTRVDPRTPHIGSMMRSSCDLSTGTLFCVGDLFPTLRSALPNRGIAFLFSTIAAPVIIVRPESAGGIYFQLAGHMEVRAIDPAGGEITAGRMNIDISGSMKMRMTSKAVKGKITLDQIVMKTLTPEVLAQEELDDAGFLSHEIIQRMASFLPWRGSMVSLQVNDILKDGVPIPVHPLFRLMGPRLSLADRSFLIATNFELNPLLIRQLTAADMKAVLAKRRVVRRKNV